MNFSCLLPKWNAYPKIGAASEMEKIPATTKAQWHCLLVLGISSWIIMSNVDVPNHRGHAPTCEMEKCSEDAEHIGKHDEIFNCRNESKCKNVNHWENCWNDEIDKQDCI